MPSNVLPSEGCVFRLDSRDGYRQPFDVTFVDVGLSDDGFEFNGSSSYVVSGSIYNLTNVSIEVMYIPSDELGSDFYGIVSERAGWGAGTIPFDLSQYEDDVRFAIYNTTYKNASTILNIGEWNHIIATYDGANMLLYLNGLLVKTTANTEGMPAPTKEVYVGRRADVATYAKGTIKSASIYNRALTETEVKQRYKEQTFRLE